MKRMKVALDEFKKTAGFREASATLSKIASEAGDEAPASDANPAHREDFNSLVNAAVREPESKD